MKNREFIAARSSNQSQVYPELINGRKASRFSGIELLKIMAVIFIILSHTLPCYGDSSADSFVSYDLYYSNFQYMLVGYFRWYGQAGNVIFIFCSAYFLVDSKTVKGKKILYIICDTFVISVIYLCGFLAAGYNLSVGTIAAQFIPITRRFYWFIGTYLIVYAIHPLLNKIIYGTGKRNLLIFNIFLFVLYNVVEFISGDLLNMFYYTRLVGFICLYFFTAYIKLYMQNFMSNLKLQSVVLAASFVCLTGLFALTEFLGSKTGFMSDKINHWSAINNPFMIGIAFSSFALFSKLNIQSKFINYLSSLSLLIYIIHENKLLKNLVKPQIFNFIYQKFSYDYLVGWIVLLTIATFVIAAALAAVYKQTVGWLIKAAIDKCYPKLSAVGNKLLDKLESND